MSSEGLAVTIAEIRGGLDRGEFPDEAAVSQGIVMPVLQALGWPVFAPKVVRKEYPIRSRKVDYALFGQLDTPSVLIEVKRVGNAAKGEEQLFEYAFNQGAMILVLTDGKSWSLYFAAGGGRYQDRRFAKADLPDDPPEVSAKTLSRYLDYETVCSDEARRRAQAAYESGRKQRTADETLPVAWSRLVSEPNASLIETLASAVESECTVRPTNESVIAFLDGLSAPVLPKPVPRPPDSRRPRRRKRPGRLWLEMDDGRQHFHTAKEVIVAVFTGLANRVPGFCERYVATYASRKRQYIARTTEELYPTRPDLLPTSVPLPGGWWFGPAMHNSGKMRRIREACEVAGIEFGQDLKVRLSSTKK